MAPMGVPWPSRGVPWPLYEDHALELSYYIYSGETQRTAATAAVSLEKSPFVARELTDDSVVR